MPATLGPISLEAQSGLMGAAAAFAWMLAVVVHRGNPGARRFALLAGAYGLWNGARGLSFLGLEQAARLEFAAVWLTGPACVELALAFCGRDELAHRWRTSAWIVAALGAAVAAAGPPIWLPPFAYAWALAGALTATGLLLHPAQPEIPGEHIRVRYLAIAHALAVLGAVTDVISWWLGWPRVLVSLAPQLYLFVAYLQVTRVRIADVRQLVGNAAALLLMALGITGLFAAIRVAVGEHVDLFLFNAFVASFVLLLAFAPMRQLVYSSIDRLFVADRLELERSLRPLSEKLPHLFTLDEILNDLLAALESTSRLRTASVFLRDDHTIGFQQAGSLGLPPRARVSLMRDPIWVAALEESDVLLDVDLAKSFEATSDADERRRLAVVRKTMRDLDAQIVLPLRTDAGLVGFWTLKDARSEESLSSPEIQLLREVSDRLALAIQDSRSFERIRARDRLVALGEMSSGLAHEIRNPLAAIRGSLALLEDTESTAEDAQVFRRVVVEEIQRLDRVVETFLDYSRPDPRRKPLADVGQFVKACVASVARDMKRPEVRLHLDIEPELPEPEVDAAQLERVIVNVIQNAYQAIDGEGRVRISVRSEPTDDERDAWIEISVSDDGPGMDEPTLDRAFVPFFTTRDDGTGLGLALCERLVRTQGGTIDLRSRPGEGTSVQIRIPCHDVELRT
jgi:signal transduction histidine kinase